MKLKKLSLSIVAVLLIFDLTACRASDDAVLKTEGYHKEFKSQESMDCNTDILSVLNGLKDNWGEKLFFETDSNDDNSQVVMLFNKSTRTYTILKLMTFEEDLPDGKGKDKYYAICTLLNGKNSIDARIFADRKN